MPESLQDEVAVNLAARAEPAATEPLMRTHGKLSLDDLTGIMRQVLDNNRLEVSKVRPFFWSMIEAYVDRFQVYPFDVVKALISWLETQDYPDSELRELIVKMESLYEQHHGRPFRGRVTPDRREPGADDEVMILRQSLKYAAIVGERYDD